jgi:hypothetical protein
LHICGRHLPSYVICMCFPIDGPSTQYLSKQHQVCRYIFIDTHTHIYTSYNNRNEEGQGRWV